MPSFSLEVSVDAPPELVFDIFSDFPSHADIVSDIDSIEMLTDPPVGIATRFRETRTLQKRPHRETFEVTGFDPPHSFTLEANPSGGFYRIAYSFIRQPDDSTLVIYSVTVEYESISTQVFSSLIWPILQPQLHGVVGKDLHELKAVAESYN